MTITGAVFRATLYSKSHSDAYFDSSLAKTDAYPSANEDEQFVWYPGSGCGSARRAAKARKRQKPKQAWKGVGI